LLNYLSVQVACPTTSSYLTWTFTATENNTVSLVCYTTIIFCQACTQITYYDWGQIGQSWLSQTVNPTSISVANPQYQDTGTKGQDKTFWGIAAFNVSRGAMRQFNF
jgi:putative effector of murein hydrolase